MATLKSHREHTISKVMLSMAIECSDNRDDDQDGDDGDEVMLARDDGYDGGDYDDYDDNCNDSCARQQSPEVFCGQ